MFIVRTLVFVMYSIGGYLTWDIVKTNYEEEKWIAQRKDVEFKFNWPKEIFIGLVIWIFSPVWMIGFTVIIIKSRLLKK